MNFNNSFSTVALVLIILAHWVPAAIAQDYPEKPRIAAASNEGENAMQGFQYPKNLKINLFASEPQLANPVAFHIDHQGRVFVCESFRQSKGIEDNRKHAEWLDEDLAAQTVQDRIDYIKKHLKEKAIEYTRYDDQIRLILDTDKDGKADSSTVFANHFNQIEMGTGAGVLSYRNKVYYTCIPDVWLLEDRDGDRVAEHRKSLHSGYGVRFAFRGHDLHGLIIGPDGRLYFSIGDRGYNVQSNGKRFKDPASGAVFRCELDGSGLEVVATGLRNPQELAFDEFGNLFTCDNNSDSGDKARWVYVVPGSDSGWRMYYQYLNDRGPFNREKIWHPYSKDAPAYIVPPITNLSDGPSGLAYYPGTGLGDEFKGRFFLCDFRGGPSNSGIRTFRNQPKGAFFEVVDMDQTFWRQLATDVHFAPDGSLYVSDWVNGWEGLGKGRIYRYSNPAAAKDMGVAEVQRVLNAGTAEFDVKQLIQLLSSADQRVRQEAQFELARRDQPDALLTVALNENLETLPRIHAVWAIGQIHRRQPNTGLILKLKELFSSGDSEITAQYLKLISDSPVNTLANGISPLLMHQNSRVRFFAALALGKQKMADTKQTGTVSAKLFQMLEENADADPILRHGGIMSLVYQNNPVQLDAAIKHPSRFVRVAAAIALRKIRSPRISELLQDPEARIVLEAVRAIHDLPIESELEKISTLSRSVTYADPIIRRSLNAHFRKGSSSSADSVAQLAADRSASKKMRIEALDMLRSWANPSNRDRVLGDWRPLSRKNRDESYRIAANAMKKNLAAILSGDPEINRKVIEVAAVLNIREIGPTVKKTFADPSADPVDRADALRAMQVLKVTELARVASDAIQDKSWQVRIVAREILVRQNPQLAEKSLRQALTSDVLAEQQAAYHSVSNLKADRAAPILVEKMNALIDGKIPANIQLDLLEAAEKVNSPPLKMRLKKHAASRPSTDPVAQYSESLEGGNASLGERIFFEKASVYCMRCHKIDQRGGDVGPDLTHIGKDKDRKYLLEAIVAPDRSIAKNFETVMVATDDGLNHSGILKSESETELVLITPDAKTITIDKEAIEQRGKGKSSMPADLIKNLSKREIRDLVEFLFSKK